jgi:hypothetical protein
MSVLTSLENARLPFDVPRPPTFPLGLKPPPPDWGRLPKGHTIVSPWSEPILLDR